MPSERRDLISDLYHRTLARAPEERAAFLAEACKGDEGLRQEIESLLEFESASARFLERPAAGAATDAASRTSMIERRIGPYMVVAPLGAGGMGEVYRARDSKLGRDVAIKILPAHFTADPERRARFAREARLLATAQAGPKCTYEPSRGMRPPLTRSRASAVGRRGGAATDRSSSFSALTAP